MVAVPDVAVTSSLVLTKEIPANSKIQEDSDILMDTVQIASFYFRLLLLIIGWICNPSAFMVFSRKVYRGSTISISLRILAVSDLAVLSNAITRHLLQGTNIDAAMRDLSCRITRFFIYFCVYVSSWVLVVVSGERVVAIIWPHKIHVICSVRSTGVILFCLFLFLALLSLPYPFIYSDLESFDLVSNTTFVEKCVLALNSEYQDVLVTLGITDSIMFVFLPTLLLMIFNIIIVTGVVKSRHRVSKISSHNKYKPTKNSGSSTDNSLGRNPKIKRELSLTVMLITINTTFIVCNLPGYAWYFLFLFQTDSRMESTYYIVYDMLNSLVFTNNALNFVLYCATGSRFRAELKAMFREIGADCRIVK